MKIIKYMPQYILGVNAHEEFGVKSILIMQAHYAGSLSGSLYGLIMQIYSKNIYPCKVSNMRKYLLL